MIETVCILHMYPDVGFPVISPRTLHQFWASMEPYDSLRFASAQWLSDYSVHTNNSGGCSIFVHKWLYISTGGGRKRFRTACPISRTSQKSIPPPPTSVTCGPKLKNYMPIKSSWAADPKHVANMTILCKIRYGNVIIWFQCWDWSCVGNPLNVVGWSRYIFATVRKCLSVAHCVLTLKWLATLKIQMRVLVLEVAQDSIFWTPHHPDSLFECKFCIPSRISPG